MLKADLRSIKYGHVDVLKAAMIDLGQIRQCNSNRNSKMALQIIQVTELPDGTLKSLDKDLPKQSVYSNSIIYTMKQSPPTTHKQNTTAQGAKAAQLPNPSLIPLRGLEPITSQASGINQNP